MFSTYSTMSALSNISIPVLGSSRNGTWNLPVFSIISACFSLPLGQYLTTCGIASSVSDSRTALVKGLASYVHSVSGAIASPASAAAEAREGRNLRPFRRATAAA